MAPLAPLPPTALALALAATKSGAMTCHAPPTARPPSLGEAGTQTGKPNRSSTTDMANTWSVEDESGEVRLIMRLATSVDVEAKLVHYLNLRLLNLN